MILLSWVVGSGSPGAEILPRIGVLPFRVHSLTPMDHLREGLQEMVVSRLAEKGFDIVPAGEINKHPMAYLPMFEERDLRTIARDVGADWIVSGSITQVGRKISLDIKGVNVSGDAPTFSVFVVEDDMERLSDAADRVADGVYNQVAGVVQIDSIEIRGNKRIEKEAIRAVIGSREGDKLDQDSLDRDLRSVYKMGYFTDVSIEVEDAAEGKVVIFNVEEKSSIGSIVFRGNDEFDDDKLMEEIGIKRYAILNRSEVTQSVNRLKEFYRQAGYYNIRIQDTIEPLAGNEVSLIYEIEEGEKVYVTRIEFQGNEAFDDDDLKELMETSEKGFLSWFTKSGLLDRKMLEFDLHKIVSFYHNHGYIKAKTGEPEVTYKEGDGLTVTIEVIEGPQYGVDQVNVEGDLIRDPEELLAKTGIQEEEYFNREVVRKDALALQELYANEGYAYVEVDPRVVEDEETRTVDVTYVVSKGVKVRFQRINIAGNQTTRDKVIRRELKAIEGETYSHKALKKGTENLHRLGFFEEVEVQTEKGGSEEQMVVNVNVKERATGSFSLGAGYSSFDKTMGSIEVAERNLFGYGQQLKLSARIGARTQQFDIRFTEPWFMGTRVAAGVDLYKWEREFWEYTKDSLGGALRFRFPIGIDEEYTRGSVRYIYDDADVTDIESGAATVIKDMEGRTVKSSITFGLERDSKDRPFLTTKGSYSYITYEHAGGFLGGDSGFGKVEASTAWYFPFPWDTVFVLRGQWGWVGERSDGRLPLYEKFYLGGIDSVRGFEYGTISPRDPATNDRIGGEKMMAYTMEYRFPLMQEQGIVGVAFFDAGNVFTEDESYSFGGIRKSAGAG
ncbi:MAG: outer membrane protein assembly factor BamA, partial [Deltaproteobacteria bacterium]|nr:outer membrane protein assembly factor BamA [Deltaproteobacteria bacterium]